MKYADAAIMNFYERPDFQQRALTHSLSPDDIRPDDYAAIYFTGGHGVMWDFPMIQPYIKSPYESIKMGAFCPPSVTGSRGCLT